MNTYYGKEVKMGGTWYTIKYRENSLRDAVKRFNKEFVVGRISLYGPIVEGVRGRFIKSEGF